MKDFSTKFEALAKQTKEVTDKFQEAKAQFGEGVPPELEDCMWNLQCAIRSIAYQMQYLGEAFAEHMKGHLPNIKSTEQLERAVKVLGLEAEYEVVKPTISANRGSVFYIG